MRRTVQRPEPVVCALERGFREAGAEGSGILLAVSGGADSLALLLGSARLASPLRLELEVACLDHGLRPEAAGELAAVQSLAERLGFPFHTRRLGLVAGRSLEERARLARYAALEAMRAERGLGWIATAHTANDQAETLLMRLARGASLRGAAGVLPRRGRILRPLLECTRSEVESFVAGAGQDPARDPMNEDRAFLRVRVRRDVLPALAQATGPSVIRHLSRFARLAHEDEELLAALALEAWGRLASGVGALDAVGVRALLPPLRRRVLARLLEERGIAVDLPLLERVAFALERGGRVGLTGGWELRCSGGELRCVRSGQPPALPTLTLGLEEVVRDDAAGLTFGLTRRPPSAESSFIELPASVGVPLTIRRRWPGDRVAAGPRGTSRKLQDLLVDRRVRAEDRDLIPIVTDQEGRILWVLGVWSERVRASRGLYLFALHNS